MTIGNISIKRCPLCRGWGSVGWGCGGGGSTLSLSLIDYSVFPAQWFEGLSRDYEALSVSFGTSRPFPV